MPMNYLDIVVVISLFYGIVKGFSNGIIIEISNIISLFLAIYIGVNFSQLIYPYLKTEILSDYSKIVPLIAFLIVFIITIIIVKSIGELINKITKQLALGFISRLLGAVFGMLKILVVCIFLLMLVIDYSIIDNKTKETSVFLNPLEKTAKIILPEIQKKTRLIIEATKDSREKAKRTIEKKINPE